MIEHTLSALHLLEGVWSGVLTVKGADANYQPEVKVTHLENLVPDVTVIEDRDNSCWAVTVPVPVASISDGVQTFLIEDGRTGERLASFTLLCGDMLDDNIRSELDLLRAELDMLKKAFRRHCVETM